MADEVFDIEKLARLDAEYGAVPRGPAPAVFTRVPMSDGHRRIRAIAIVFFMAFIAMLVGFVVLAAQYKEQNQAMTKCYAAATASHSEAVAAEYQREGDAKGQALALADARSALRAIGAPDSDAAWLNCTAAFAAR